MSTENCFSTCEEWTPPGQLLELAEDDDTLLPELLGAFQEDTRKRLDRIRTAVAAGDTAKLRAEAHTIKGSARQMGAGAVADICRDLEMNAARLTAATAAESVGQLEARFGEICVTMTRYLARA